jgi:hypothetical protein
MQISFKKILIASIAPLLFASCGGGSNDSVKFTDAEKQFVKNLFLTEYLWAAEVDASIDQTYLPIKADDAGIFSGRLPIPLGLLF